MKGGKNRSQFSTFSQQNVGSAACISMRGISFQPAVQIATVQLSSIIFSCEGFFFSRSVNMMFKKGGLDLHILIVLVYGRRERETNIYQTSVL